MTLSASTSTTTICSPALCSLPSSGSYLSNIYKIYNIYNPSASRQSCSWWCCWSPCWVPASPSCWRTRPPSSSSSQSVVEPCSTADLILLIFRKRYSRRKNMVEALLEDKMSLQRIKLTRHFTQVRQKDKCPEIHSAHHIPGSPPVQG